MPKKASKKYRVYLAGPMHGCNHEQKTRWRTMVKNRWGEEFEFIDPTEQLVPEDGKSDDASFEIIRKDEEAIKSADAILANMWKESIGTAIGIVVARKQGKPVVVVDRNHLGNRALAYYADAICESENEGIRQLKAILKQQERIKWVIKKGGAAEEAFSREKMSQSIRKACNAAGQDDLIATSRIVPAALERLVEGRKMGERRVTTTDIKNAIWDVLVELESDPLRCDCFVGIRSAWEAFDEKKRADDISIPVIRDRHGEMISDQPQNIPVETGKSHSSIWGRNITGLKDIPPSARPLFREICRVRGIQKIRLGQMSAGQKVTRCAAEIFASRQECVIEGKCYDNGVKGNVQTFQIIVSDPGDKERIRQALMSHLSGKGMLKLKDQDL